ncbi:hypothetical protein [Neisseria cinerea]
MRTIKFVSLSIFSIMLSACSATDPGLFKTNQPLTLEYSELHDNLHLPFSEFSNKWLPIGAVNQTAQQISKALSYLSTSRETLGVKNGERLENYAATDSYGNDRHIIQKAKDTFQAWCAHHSGEIGTPNTYQENYINQVMVSKNTPSSGMYYELSDAYSCTKNGKVVATLAYSEGEVQGLSSNYTFPSVLIFVKDWNK